MVSAWGVRQLHLLQQPLQQLVELR
jgi:hypothetical protein